MSAMARVLVVDDEKLIVKGIRFSLEQDGMEVDCAYDGEEAIAKAKETEYDVVLLDVMLPKFDGLAVSMIMGISENSRMAWQTSSPSNLGSITSKSRCV